MRAKRGRERTSHTGDISPSPFVRRKELILSAYYGDLKDAKGSFYATCDTVVRSTVINHIHTIAREGLATCLGWLAAGGEITSDDRLWILEQSVHFGQDCPVSFAQQGDIVTHHIDSLSGISPQRVEALRSRVEKVRP